MAQARFPDEFSQRILAIEAPGGKVEEVTLTAPTVVAPNEPFRVKVAALDSDGYPSVECSAAVAVAGDFADPASMEVAFEAGRPAVGWIEGVVIEKPGLYRFEGMLGGEAWRSNPVLCEEDPAARVYWGDPHVHTTLSRCHPDKCRSLNFCYAAARHMSGLDWVGAADHVSNERCDLGTWKDQCATCDAWDDPPRFATLPSYEASLKGGAGGDNNVYMRVQPDMYVDEFEEGNTKTLAKGLAAKIGADSFIVVPHHTTRTGKHGEISDDIYPGEEWMPVLEIHSKWGTSEYRGNPNALHNVHDGPSFAVDFLNRGLRFGFIAGTDTHATMPSAKGVEPGHIDRLPGLTAVFAPALSREGVFQGIRQRNCYAASLERIFLRADFDGHRPGKSRQWGETARARRIAVTAAARSEIESVEIVRNGVPVYRQEPGDWKTEFSYSDQEGLDVCSLESARLGRFAYYYVRVTCVSGAQAWSSPWWLTEKAV